VCVYVCVCVCGVLTALSVCVEAQLCCVAELLLHVYVSVKARSCFAVG